MTVISVVIPTIGRATLTRAVESVFAQELDDVFEIIVVNDSGTPLEGFDCLLLPGVRVVTTNRSKLPTARNVGAAMATGEFLYFLDDDDYLLPGGLEHLLAVARSTNAGWVYGGVRCVDGDGKLVAEIRPEVTGNLFAHFISGESISVVVSLIRRDAFVRVGGFDPLMECLEDREFACRFALLNTFDRTAHLVACCRVAHPTSTFDWSKAPRATIILREKSLNAPGSLWRAVQSAGDDAFRRGRVARAYLASAAVNLKSWSLFKVANRVLSAVRVTSFYPVRGQFWQGLRGNRA
jgi:cellulose synthase/poly-beta-1,6-N-acetylglucosamine synthase-like glycosyltransferase